MTDWHPPLIAPQGEGGRAARRRAEREAAKRWPKTFSEDSPHGLAYVPSRLGPVYLPPFSALTNEGIHQCYVANYDGQNVDLKVEQKKMIQRINQRLKRWQHD